ncbi:MAG: FAD:protein FMN transferase [Cyclobacteriaceae bacterium]|nr:FAD:protein FMN transferase [Cyclobacteriaceae bacterium]
MTNRAKNILYTALLLLAMFGVWKYRQGQIILPTQIEGKTMGTTYHITYFDREGRVFQTAVDSLFVLINRSISTYDTTADIARFNKGTHGVRFTTPYFFPPLKKSQKVFSGSNGCYDPTVMPLVNAWGFGPKKVSVPDTAEVMAVRAFVGFEKIQFNEDSVWKTDPRAQLDFSGIGQGYGSDVVAEFFESKGIDNYFIELGGEGVAKGKNLKENRVWEVGVLDPNSDYISKAYKAYVKLDNMGYSTSGNYFNFREVNGRKYSHTIDPKSGFPAERALLSATVFAKDCTTADAWATAFMVMGHEKAIEILPQHPELDVLLIYSQPDGKQAVYVSERMKSAVQINP